MTTTGKRKLRLGIKGKICLVTGLVFSCFMVVSSFFLLRTYDATLNQVKLSRVEERTSIMGRGIHSQIESATDTLHLTAKFFSLLDRECMVNNADMASRFTEYLSEVSESFLFFDSISIYNEHGTLLFGEKQKFFRDLSIDKLSWFKLAQYNNTITYGFPFVSKNTAQTQLPVGLGLVYEGKKYFICGLLALENLTDDYLYQHDSMEQMSFLISRNGVVLNSTLSEYKGTRILQSQMDYLHKHDFGSKRYRADGKEWYFGFYKIPQTSFYCVVYLYGDKYDDWRSMLHFKSNIVRMVSAVCAVVLALLLLMPIIRDFRSLTVYIRNISNKNFEKIRVEKRILNRNDELGDFALTLDKMVQKFIEMLSKANENSKIKNKFIEKMSHEIRVPVDNINAVSVLALQNCEDPLQKNYWKQVEITSQNVLKLVDNVLDFSRSEIENCLVNDELFDFSEMLYSVKSLLKKKSAEKGLKYNVAVENEVPKYIRSNKENLRRILLNLTNNAIKFTQKGFVHVGISYEEYKDGYALIFEVIDSGIGMDDEKIQQVFSQDLYNADVLGFNGLNARGLLIVKTLVEAMQGEIEVKSKINKGTSVRVVVPVRSVDLDEKNDEFILPEFNKNFLTVLVAEGDKAVLERLQNLLEQANCRVLVAVNGDDAVKIAQENMLDVAFVDMEMPIMNGFDTVKNILAVPENRNLLVVGMSKNFTFEMKTECYEAGIAECLDKAFSAESFYKLLKVWAGKIKG